jgi:hypothetical protein
VRPSQRPAARQSPACSRAQPASARSRRRHEQAAQSDYAAFWTATARTAPGAFAPSAGLRAGSSRSGPSHQPPGHPHDRSGQRCCPRVRRAASACAVLRPGAQICSS